MSRFTRPTRLAGLGLAAVLTGFLANTLAAQPPAAARASQQPAAPAPSAEAKKQSQSPTMMGQNMMAMRQKMMADSKAADAQLQPLVDKMEAAKGPAKVDAMAAVLTELVRQRTIARGHMDQMSQMMMPNMMGMMMQGMTADMRKMAAQCPMMKGFSETPPK